MKKNIIIVLLLIVFLVCGCRNEMEKNYDSADRVPSQFNSENKFIEGVRLSKQSEEKVVDAKIGGKLNNDDGLEKITYYYMPLKIPEGFEFESIFVVPDSVYIKYNYIDESEIEGTFYFKYYNLDSGWNIEETIKKNELVKSKFSDKLFFAIKDSRISKYVFFEYEEQVFLLTFSNGISLDDEVEVKLAEEFCVIEKKYIE